MRQSRDGAYYSISAGVSVDTGGVDKWLEEKRRQQEPLRRSVRSRWALISRTEGADPLRDYELRAAIIEAINDASMGWEKGIDDDDAVNGIIRLLWGDEER